MPDPSCFFFLAARSSAWRSLRFTWGSGPHPSSDGPTASRNHPSEFAMLDITPPPRRRRVGFTFAAETATIKRARASKRASILRQKRPRVHVRALPTNTGASREARAQPQPLRSAQTAGRDCPPLRIGARQSTPARLSPGAWGTWLWQNGALCWWRGSTKRPSRPPCPENAPKLLGSPRFYYVAPAERRASAALLKRSVLKRPETTFGM